MVVRSGLASRAGELDEPVSDRPPAARAARGLVPPLDRRCSSGHAGYVGRRRRARSRALRPGTAAEARNPRPRNVPDVAVNAEVPGWVVVTQLADPAVAGRLDATRRAQSVRRRSCRPSATRAATAAGSGSGFPARAAGRSIWSTRLGTSARGWPSRPWPGWPGESRSRDRRSGNRGGGTSEQSGRRGDRGGLGIRGAGADPDPAEPSPGARSRRRPRGRTSRPGSTPCIPACRADRPGLRALRRRPDRRAGARFAFLALPHTASMAVVPALRERETCASST